MQLASFHRRRNELRDLPECAFLLTLPLEIPITDDDFTPPDMDLAMHMAIVSDLEIFGHQPESYWDCVPDWLHRMLADKKYGYRAMSMWHRAICARYRREVMPVLCRHFGIDKGEKLFPHIHRLADLPRELWPNQSRYSKKKHINWILRSLREQLDDYPEPTPDVIASARRGIMHTAEHLRRELGIKTKDVRPAVVPMPARAV